VSVLRTEPAGQVRGLDAVVAAALSEDVGTGDLTTEGLFGTRETACAELFLEEPGVVSGITVAAHVFRMLDPEIELEAIAADGDRIEQVPAVVMRVEGRVRTLLTGERVALNLLGRLSGIATLTRAYVDAVEGAGAVILDTRKTTPGLRGLEKEAVRHGGGTNHRLGLFDAILVKENHLRLAAGIPAAVERLRAAYPDRPLEVEVETLEELDEAIAAGAERILLDNMTVEALREAVARVNGRAELEASGGVSLATVRAIAESGVDFVSVGALTHAARSLDVSMEVLQ
jgi:nicotinate-nucleotide pyrophosphorylase (carboxylating)